MFSVIASGSSSSKHHDRSSRGCRGHGRSLKQKCKEEQKACEWCGRKNAREGCPAGSLLCQRCGKLDHFARIYRFRRQNTTHVRAIDEAVCLGAIDSENHWKTTLFVNGQPMKVETSANVTAIPEGTLLKIANRDDGLGILVL